jgi:hypothetical protein
MPEKLAQRAGGADGHVAASDGWHELAVANPTFLLERLGSECTDLQGLRELTVNGLDAIAALGADANGRVVWDLDWERFDASGGRVRKLSVIDTGTGMTAAQLRYYINQLAASGREQSSRGNFGVGAKVAVGSRNPHGLEYRSWHQGEGSLVCFKRHPDGRWGLEPQRWADGRTDFWRPLGEAEKPWLLRGEDHGTQVVLLGQDEQHDTTQTPQSVTDARGQWIPRYLNRRFVRLPMQVEVLVREDLGRAEPGQLRWIHGERHHLDRRAVAAGAVELSDALAYWWLLDDDHRGRRRESVEWASTGHAAAVFGHELYDVLPQTRGGYGRLQDFGIRFGYERVVLHLEPQAQAGRLESNTARTLLLLDHEPLPWSRWGDEFVTKMPDEIRRLQERAAGADCLPRQEAIRSRVTAILPLYRLSRYRPPRPPGRPSPKPATGSPEAESANRRAEPSAPPTHPPTTHPLSASSGGAVAPGWAGGESPAVEADPEAHRLTTVDLPDVAWISARDRTRAPGDLEDQAARYHPGRHELTINSDFRAISDLITHWCHRYPGVPGARTVIEAQVREWCEQVLVEVVLAVRNSDWNEERLGALLSPTSFTAALLPRHLLHTTLQKRLAQKLGTPRSEPAQYSSGASDARRGGTRARGLREHDESDHERQQDAAQLGGRARASPMIPGGEHAPA